MATYSGKALGFLEFIESIMKQSFPEKRGR